MTATELKKRAIALAEKTKIDSVTPEEVGQLSNDIVEYIENVELNGSTLGIRRSVVSRQRKGFQFPEPRMGVQDVRQCRNCNTR